MGTPCRLSKNASNHGAHEAYRMALEQLGNGCCAKYCCITCCLIFGLVLVIPGLASGETGPGGAILIVALCLVLGVPCQLQMLIGSQTSTNDNGVSLGRFCLKTILDERVQRDATRYRTLYSQIRKPSEDEVVAIISRYFPEQVAMNYAGYVSFPALATYSLAWSELEENARISTTNLKRLQTIHKAWRDHVEAFANAAYGITRYIDSKRARALGQKGVADAIKLVPIVGEVVTIIDDFQSIRENLSSAGLRIDAPSTVHRSGIHDVLVVNVFIGVAFIVSMCFLFPIILFSVVGKPVYIAISVPIGFLLFGILYVAIKASNDAYNTLEDMVQIERELRAALAKETSQRFPGELCESINFLRGLVMEAYFDALGIHLQSDLMTIDGIPEYENPTPLFWSANVDKATASSTTVDHEVESIDGSQGDSDNPFIEPTAVSTNTHNIRQESTALTESERNETVYRDLEAGLSATSEDLDRGEYEERAIIVDCSTQAELDDKEQSREPSMIMNGVHVPLPSNGDERRRSSRDRLDP